MEQTGKISFVAAVLIAVNIMIGAGIYVLPQNLALTADSFSFLSWPLAALLLFPVIWGVAQASKIFPGEGGFYNYCKCGIGPVAGFLANWAYLLGYLGTATAITGFLRMHISTQFGLPEVDQHFMLFNFALITLVTLLNLASIELISKIQGSATILKLTPLFFVLVAFLFYLKPSMNFNYEYLPKLPFAIPLALFAFWGFESCCGIGHLIKGGPSQISKVVFTAFFAVTTIYTLFHFGVLHIMGIENLKLFGAAAFPRFLGLGESATYLINLGISCAILLSLANTLYGVAMINTTNMFTLASQKSLPWAGWLTNNNRYQRPYNAIFLHGVIIVTFITIIPNTEIWAKLTGLGIMTALSLTQISVFLYFLRAKQFGNLIFTGLGLVSLSIAGIFTWMALGEDTFSRLLSMSPMIIGFMFGTIMFYIQKCKDKCAL